MCWFCQISKWVHHRYTCVPHSEPSSLLPPHTIPLGCPSAPAPSIQYCASNLDWRLVSYMILFIFKLTGFPGGSAVKNLPAMQESQKRQVRSLGQEDPLEKETATHSSILVWRIPRTEESGGLQSIGSQRVHHYWRNLTHTHTHTHTHTLNWHNINVKYISIFKREQIQLTSIHKNVYFH